MVFSQILCRFQCTSLLKCQKWNRERVTTAEMKSVTWLVALLYSAAYVDRACCCASLVKAINVIGSTCEFPFLHLNGFCAAHSSSSRQVYSRGNLVGARGIVGTSPPINSRGTRRLQRQLQWACRGQPSGLEIGPKPLLCQLLCCSVSKRSCAVFFLAVGGGYFDTYQVFQRTVNFRTAAVDYNRKDYKDYKDYNPTKPSEPM